MRLARLLLKKRAVSREKNPTKSRVGMAPKARFSSKMCPYANTLLRMRYAEKIPTAQVLAWLAQQGVVVRRDSFQFFMGRMLNLMDDDKAKRFGIELDLLRAVRRRLQFPVTPVSGRARRVKAMVAFNACSRRRRKVRPEPRAKASKVPAPAPPVSRHQPKPDQTPAAGKVVSPSIEEMYRKLSGTPEQPNGLLDEKIINEVARAKLRQINSKIYPNWGGMVWNCVTKQTYTVEQLVELGLSPNEAESCFEDFGS